MPKSVAFIWAVILLPLADSFSALAPPSCARRPHPVALRPTTPGARTSGSSVRMMSASSESMAASSEALLAAADHIVAAAAILGENQCDEEDPASLSAGGCSIANAGRDCAMVARALGHGQWKDGATDPLCAMAGSFFIAAASLADVLSVGAALGEAGIEIEDGSKLMPAEAGLSLIGAGLATIMSLSLSQTALKPKPKPSTLNPQPSILNPHWSRRIAGVGRRGHGSVCKRHEGRRGHQKGGGLPFVGGRSETRTGGGEA